MSKVEVDIGDFTIEEAELFESESGVSLSDLDKGVPVKALAYLVWIAQRRNNPDYTIEMARKVKMSDLSFPEGNPT